VGEEKEEEEEEEEERPPRVTMSARSATMIPRYEQRRLGRVRSSEDENESPP